MTVSPRKITPSPKHSSNIEELSNVLRETNTHLAALTQDVKSIADSVDGLKRFVNKWAGWLVAGGLAVVQILYPALAKLLTEVAKHASVISGP